MNVMRIKTYVTEDFTNYKRPSMFIGCVSCDGKCCREGGFPLTTCINNDWCATNTVNVDDDELIRLYMSNPITSAICFGLLEPFMQFEEIYEFINKLRREYGREDVVVIYTGYYEHEIEEQVNKLKELENIIIKFGRFLPNQEHHFDEVLGVELASPNQYAKRIG